MAEARVDRRRLERGASALEMAFVAPGLILLIFFSIQAALFFYGRNVAIQAAREGVSQMRVAPDATTYEGMRDGIVDNTERFARTVGRESLTGAVATPTYDERAGRVSMTVSGHVISLVPGLRLDVSQTAEGPVERFEADR